MWHQSIHTNSSVKDKKMISLIKSILKYAKRGISFVYMWQLKSITTFKICIYHNYVCGIARVVSKTQQSLSLYHPSRKLWRSELNKGLSFLTPKARHPYNYAAVPTQPVHKFNLLTVISCMLC